MGGRNGNHYVWAQQVKRFKRHASDGILNELARGELSRQAARRTNRHLEECVDCFHRYKALLRSLPDEESGE